ncbi:hypothetical protein Ddc_15702 [Ditylenchus destructor]|nr:hypothetical protein Ddc_15702 [Ditylenchus destructor]
MSRYRKPTLRPAPILIHTTYLYLCAEFPYLFNSQDNSLSGKMTQDSENPWIHNKFVANQFLNNSYLVNRLLNNRYINPQWMHARLLLSKEDKGHGSRRN